MRKEPRDYQNWAHNATMNYLMDPANFTGGVATGGKGPKYPLVVEATGLGKSLNIAMLIWHLLSMWPHLRIMQLAHVKELVKGNYEELMGFYPQAPAGVYAAGLGRKDTNAQVTFAMINSVAKRAPTFGHIDFVLVDEAHRLSDNDAALYSKLIAALRLRNPNLIMIGYTATDFRMKGGRLTEMGLFDDVVYDIGGGESFLWAVEQGYLIRPVPTDPGFQLDSSGIGTSAGDFKNKEASDAMRDQGIIEQAIDYSIQVAQNENRRCAVAFAQSIDDAELIADMLTMKGFPTEAVHNKRSDRDAVIEAHERGEIWGIANNNILTTGWNNPLVDMMMGLRLTRSAGLWVQMIGRLTRPLWTNHFFGQIDGPALDEEGRHNIGTLEGRLASIQESGKLNARVLDFCGNTERLGPINYPNVPRPRKAGGGGGEMPVRKCDGSSEKGRALGMRCNPITLHHTSVTICPDCGYVFPPPERVGLTASTAELVADSPDDVIDLTNLPPPPEKEFSVLSVHGMTAVLNHGKNGKKDTMKITYTSGFQNYSTWVCIEHPKKSFPRVKAEQWWNQHGGLGPCPTIVDEAVEAVGSMTKPKFIKVWVNTRFPEIVGLDFIGTKFPEIIDLTGAPLEIFEPDPDPMLEFREKEAASVASAREWATGGYGYDDDIPF